MLLSGLIQRIRKGRSHVSVQGYARGPLCILGGFVLAAQVPWRGEIELRGLSDRTYRVTDYVHGKDFGVVKGPTAKLSTEIHGSLLLEER